MSKMFLGSLDLNKIDPKKVVKFDKNGQRFSNGAKYYPIVVWLNDEVDKYGNIASVQEGQSTEERDNKAKAVYLGNLKNLPGQNVSEDTKNEPLAPTNRDNDDDLPF